MLIWRLRADRTAKDAASIARLDPVAAFGIAALLVKAGRQGLRSESCCETDHCY